MAELASLRGAVYRLLSQGLLYPTRERLASLEEALRALQDDEEVLTHFFFYPRWLEFRAAIGALSGRELWGVQGEYVRVFLANTTGVPCPPYESAILEADGGSDSSAAWLLGRLEREYASSGLVRSQEAGEPPDHVSVELEFLAVLCAREAEQWAAGPAQAQAIATVRREWGFIRRHPGAWLPLLAKRASGVRSREFAAVCAAAAAFVRHEEDLLETLLEERERVERRPHGQRKRR